MKKIIVAIILFISFFLGNTSMADGKLAHWENPKAIKVYIKPDQDKMLMKKAFSTWSSATNGKVGFIYVTSPDKAQITVSFHKTLPKISETTERGGLTRVHTISPEDEIIDIAYIYLAKELNFGWVYNSDTRYKIMLHEIGHALGIFDHSDVMDSIMNTKIPHSQQRITKYDLDNLKRAYGWK